GVPDVPDVPVGIGVLVGAGAAVIGAAPAGDGLVADVLAGFEGFAVEEGFAAGAIAPAFSDPVAPAAMFTPPAACSNSFKCVRNSCSFVLIAGSICIAGPAVPAAPVVPAVAVGAPAVPLMPVAVEGLDASGPINVSRLAESFAYAAFQSACVVISSLKLEISCETCVRASPCSFAASGS